MYGRGARTTTTGRKPTAHSNKARAKIGMYPPIHGTGTPRRRFKTELGDLPESTVHMYKQLHLQKEICKSSFLHVQIAKTFITLHHFY